MNGKIVIYKKVECTTLTRIPLNFSRRPKFPRKIQGHTKCEQHFFQIILGFWPEYFEYSNVQNAAPGHTSPFVWAVTSIDTTLIQFQQKHKDVILALAGRGRWGWQWAGSVAEQETDRCFSIMAAPRSTAKWGCTIMISDVWTMRESSQSRPSPGGGSDST